MQRSNVEFQPKIDVIHPTLDIDSALEPQKPKLKRVAAYARVSTQQDEQQNSYEAQVAYYTRFILSNPEWEFVKVYSDEGLSGTNMKKRPGFLEMIEDAKAGKIDLILTKSISRFARNTVDSLQATRDLKDAGVEVRFEKEGVSSFDPTAEMVFTVFSSAAQEESRSISENVKWGQKRRMEKGQTHVAFSSFLGYAKGPNGAWVIVEDEARIVRQIYDWFLDDGRTLNWIAEELTRRGEKTPRKKDVWSVSTVKSILSNEKYRGDAELQKSYVPNYLTHKSVKNNGERTKYYVHDHHEAIIPPERFDLAKKELERRSMHRRQISNNSPFTARIVCADCGGFFGHKIQRKKQVWYCNHRYDGEKTCETPIIPEDYLKAYFEEALEREIALIAAGKGPKTPGEAEEAILTDQLVKARDRAEEARDRAVEEYQREFSGAVKVADRDDFDRRYEAAVARVNQSKAALAEAEDAIVVNTARKENIRRFTEAIRAVDPDAVSYSDELFIATIKHADVSKVIDGKYSITYHFTNGGQVTLKNLG